MDLHHHGLREPREGRLRTSTCRTTCHHGQRLSTPTTSMWLYEHGGAVTRGAEAPSPTSTSSTTLTS
uniref:Uncharacterized protein n=1 Tax=Triticum urartu TaxID=4572 RepID=A0A8R7U9W9_TRIUA